MASVAATGSRPPMPWPLDWASDGPLQAVAEIFGHRPKSGDATGAALAAVEAELVVVGRAAFRVLQAMRQEEQPAAVRHGGHLLAPKRRGQDHHRPADVAFGQAEL